MGDNVDLTVNCDQVSVEVIDDVVNVKVGCWSRPGPVGPPGGGFNIIGVLPSVEDLPDIAEPGDGYIIDGFLWVYTLEDGWQRLEVDTGYIPSYDPNVSYSSGQVVIYGYGLYWAVGPSLGMQPDISPGAWLWLSDKHGVFIFEEENEVSVSHLLDKFPAVTVVDSEQNEVVAEIEYIDKASFVVRFNSVESGMILAN